MNGKLDIKVGNATFSAEGDPGWIEARLSDFYDRAGFGQGADAPNDFANESSTSDDGIEAKPNGQGTTLPNYLKSVAVGTNQTKKFLATAIWLRDRLGLKTPTTGEVVKALKDTHQSKLGNATQCLNSNVTKGFCEKTNNGKFFITDEGTQSLA